MTQRTRLVLSAIATAFLLSACAQSLQGPGMQVSQQGGMAARGETHSVLVGAGDIAYEGPGAEATAKLLDKIPGFVFTLGDNAYQNGSHEEYQKHYHPTWGRHKARTLPVVGNHEYRTPGAAGYFDYFGAAAGDRTKGYYAVDVGPHWRVYSINSAEAGTDHASKKNMAVGSEQYRWLAADLDAHKDKNPVVMWHHPTFSSGAHGDNDETLPIWKLAQSKGVDIALWGHDHHYERFHPANAEGKRDDKNGMRAFLVGTGGKNHYRFFKFPKRLTDVRDAKSFGVLKLSLHADRYDWEFVPIEGDKFQDKGTSPTH